MKITESIWRCILSMIVYITKEDIAKLVNLKNQHDQSIVVSEKEYFVLFILKDNSRKMTIFSSIFPEIIFSRYVICFSYTLRKFVYLDYIKMALGSKYFCKMSVIDAEQGPEYVGNNAKRWILKRVLQKKKARHIFEKTSVSYTLIRTRTCAYQGVKNVMF